MSITAMTSHVILVATCRAALRAHGTHNSQGSESQELINLRAAISLQPADAQQWMDLARLLISAGSREAEVEASFQGALHAEPTDAAAWLNVGTFASRRSAFSEAEASYRQALKYDPEWYAPHYNLGEVLDRRMVLGEAEASYRAAVYFDPDESACLQGLGSAPQPRKNLGRLLVRQGRTEEGMLELRAAFDVLDRHKLSPIHFAANMHGGEEGYKQSKKSEENSFFAATKDAKVTAQGVPSGLFLALRSVRAMENSSEWLIKWSIEAEQAESIYNEHTENTYGITWFSAWQSVFMSDTVTTSLNRNQESTVVVMGSGLGDQCLFAHALGVSRCVGYEVHCESMVTPAMVLLQQYGLANSTEFICKGAEVADELQSVALVWVNDCAWPTALRWSVQTQLAMKLSEGAIVITYAEPLLLNILPVVETLQVEVSWALSQKLYIIRHAGHLSSGGDL